MTLTRPLLVALTLLAAVSAGCAEKVTPSRSAGRTTPSPSPSASASASPSPTGNSTTGSGTYAITATVTKYQAGDPSLGKTHPYKQGSTTSGTVEVQCSSTPTLSACSGLVKLPAWNLEQSTGGKAGGAPDGKSFGSVKNDPEMTVCTKPVNRYYKTTLQPTAAGTVTGGFSRETVPLTCKDAQGNVFAGETLFITYTGTLS